MCTLQKCRIIEKKKLFCTIATHQASYVYLLLPFVVSGKKTTQDNIMMLPSHRAISHIYHRAVCTLIYVIGGLQCQPSRDYSTQPGLLNILGQNNNIIHVCNFIDY